MDILLGAYSCTVQVRGVKIGGGSWDSLTASQTVPESHRPPTEMDGPLMTANGGSATGFLVVSTNGQIRVANMGSAGSTDTRNGQVSWPV